jgi:hypothetical protein
MVGKDSGSGRAQAQQAPQHLTGAPRCSCRQQFLSLVKGQRMDGRIVPDSADTEAGAQHPETR